MKEIPGQIMLLDYLESMDGNDTEVEIDGAINPKVSLKPIPCRLAYGDLTMIVAMLRDYVKGMDVVKADDFQWWAYYRNKFMQIANHISEQIGYDYEKALEKCMKKNEKEDDIGEDAFVLALKKARQEAERKAQKDAEKEANEKAV